MLSRMSDGRLPNFLVIGSMKAGTTSLFRYLSAHPEVAMGSYKEIEFFSSDEHWQLGLDWYSEFFATVDNGAIAIGECSTGYTKFPAFSHAADRIASTLPDARLIYLVREPIERMRSHYEHAVLAGGEDRPIEVAMLEDPQYVDTSRYALQLAQYLRHFDPAQLLVLDCVDLLRSRRTAMREIFGSLGVDATWWSPELEVEHYVTSARPSLRPGVRRIARSKAVRAMTRVMSPAARARMVRSRTLSTPRDDAPAPRASISASLRSELTRRLRDDVDELRAVAASTLGRPGLGRDWLPDADDPSASAAP